MSTEDGPGLRTTVFFKGCPLSCKWCHNPESIPFGFDKEWIKTSCIFCLDCVHTCSKDALSYNDGEIILNREKCSHCMDCVDICPTGAMKSIGRDMSAAELYKEIIKDKAYFTNGGGITLSGGEVLLQAREVKDLVQRLKEDGIHIAIDTSGFVDYENIEMILPYVDLFLYDLKLGDSVMHQEYCGVPNQKIKENLIKLNQEKASIWIRTPIIPTATDSKDNIQEIAIFLKENQIDFERWELCAFNNLCESKYERLDREWIFKNETLMKKEKMLELETLAKYVLENKKDQIFYTGLTKLEVQDESKIK